MGVDFKTDLSDSAYNFVRIVYPKIIECGYLSGEVIPIESVSANGITKDLDMFAGIDAWHIDKNAGIQGIASRVQFGGRAWNTFTVRKSRMLGTKTEYDKRKFAMDSGEWLYPHITIQAYISSRQGGELLSVAVANTTNIFRCISNGMFYRRLNNKDGNEFYVVDWRNVDNIDIWTK